MTILPENILFDIIELAIKNIREDYEKYSNEGREEESLLYKLFSRGILGQNLQFENYNWFEEAKNIILRRDSRRSLQVTLGFNVERSTLPTIHITLPEEGKKAGFLDFDRGYENNPETGEYREQFTYFLESTYNMIVTSDSMNETILVYHFLKNASIAFFEYYELSGLRDVQFKGHDLQFNNELIPPHVFSRNFVVSFYYENTVYSELKQGIIGDINYDNNLL